MNARSLYRQITRQAAPYGGSRRRCRLRLDMSMFEPLPQIVVDHLDQIPPTMVEHEDGSYTVYCLMSEDGPERPDGDFIHDLIDHGPDAGYARYSWLVSYAYDSATGNYSPVDVDLARAKSELLAWVDHNIHGLEFNYDDPAADPVRCALHDALNEAKSTWATHPSGDGDLFIPVNGALEIDIVLRAYETRSFVRALAKLLRVTRANDVPVQVINMPQSKARGYTLSRAQHYSTYHRQRELAMRKRMATFKGRMSWRTRNRKMPKSGVNDY